jgi:hypothetical protein
MPTRASGVEFEAREAGWWVAARLDGTGPTLDVHVFQWCKEDTAAWRWTITGERQAVGAGYRTRAAALCAAKYAAKRLLA